MFRPVGIVVLGLCPVLSYYVIERGREKKKGTTTITSLSKNFISIDIPYRIVPIQFAATSVLFPTGQSSYWQQSTQRRR
jgi:hypothetical protein